MGDSSDLELYALSGCPYCRKVESKLEELSLSYQRREVFPLKLLRREVKRVSGQRGVPVLVDNSNNIEAMPESDDIVAYLEEEYGNTTATDSQS